MAKHSDLHEFDDVFRHVKSFGRYQVIVYLSINLLVFSLTSQFGAIVFALSSPGFYCSNTKGNATCEPNKCCDECTSYVFDDTFTSSVSQVSKDNVPCVCIVGTSLMVPNKGGSRGGKGG